MRVLKLSSKALRGSRLVSARLSSRLRLAIKTAFLFFTVDLTTTKVDSSMITADKTIT